MIVLISEHNEQSKRAYLKKYKHVIKQLSGALARAAR
jgi:hypothetical protein